MTAYEPDAGDLIWVDGNPRVGRPHRKDTWLMLTTLDAIVRRLADAYEPDRVILFGSRARGPAPDGTDFDLLVVKDTNRRPLDRRIDVERILADRAVSLDLTVYTPDELRRLYAAGSPFIEDVFATGKVLYMRDATGPWVRDGDDELAMARLLLDHDMVRGACLHAQQAIEKGLKALLIERADAVPRTDDLVDLTRRVVALGWSEEPLLPHGDPTRDEASTAVKAADRLVAFVRKELAG